MWEFIKYCLKCLSMSISASFGNNPEGMTFKACNSWKYYNACIIRISFGHSMVNSSYC